MFLNTVLSNADAYNTVDAFVVPCVMGYFMLYAIYRFPPTNFVHPLSFEIAPELEKYRIDNLKNLNTTGVLPPFINFYENYRIAPEYNLATCQIQKSMSTLRAGIFCLLYDSKGFMKQNSTISEQDWHNMYCGNKNEYFSIDAVQQQLKQPFGNFAVIRDPIDRFISGFVDKCVNEADRGYCYGCQESLRCFTTVQYERFVKYITGHLSEKDIGFEDIHFAPQTWYCAFHKYFSSYRFLRYENGKDIIKMSNSLQQILRDNGVEPELLKIIEKETLKGKTYHTTHGSAIRKHFESELLNSPDLLELIIKMFYYDFAIFNYPLPRFSQQGK